ncbi:PREDICTED: hyaluronan-binding protein 2-like [Ceratosolen solmsi marchali]|uniref:Hyaluronan-binding protein 2-like n=1 Tax=Ceratosolen solmsi marchali TaxID=326594 RepID=A0AAJ7DZ06_9HYME|nr:PREDICTED: hyaluronan-binding protein 2-like [Ceratosolen solmsi marchali]
MLIYQPNSAYVGSKVIVAGWGTGNSGSSSSILQTTKLNIISNTECERVIFEIDGEKYRIHDKFICSIKKPFALLADGDSGGPLFFEKYVIGISQGTCPKLEIGFHPKKTNMHSSVNHYRYFIIHAVNMY